MMVHSSENDRLRSYISPTLGCEGPSIFKVAVFPASPHCVMTRRRSFRRLHLWKALIELCFTAMTVPAQLKLHYSSFDGLVLVHELDEISVFVYIQWNHPYSDLYSRNINGSKNNNPPPCPPLLALAPCAQHQPFSSQTFSVKCRCNLLENHTSTFTALPTLKASKVFVDEVDTLYVNMIDVNPTFKSARECSL